MDDSIITIDWFYFLKKYHWNKYKTMAESCRFFKYVWLFSRRQALKGWQTIRRSYLIIARKNVFDKLYNGWNNYHPKMKLTLECLLSTKTEIRNFRKLGDFQKFGFPEICLGQCHFRIFFFKWIFIANVKRSISLAFILVNRQYMKFFF